MSIKLFNFTVNTVASLRCRNRKHTHTLSPRQTHTLITRAPKHTIIRQTSQRDTPSSGDLSVRLHPLQSQHSNIPQFSESEEVWGGEGGRERGGGLFHSGGGEELWAPHPRHCTNTPSLLSQSIHGGTGGTGAVPSSLSFPLHPI